MCELPSPLFKREGRSRKKVEFEKLYITFVLRLTPLLKRGQGEFTNKYHIATIKLYYAL
jgi:hypothetical protein